MQIYPSTAALLTVTSIAVSTALVSIQRQHQIQRECDEIRKALSNRKRASKRACSQEVDNEQEAGLCDIPPTLRSTMDDQSILEDGLQVKPIGVVRSIYRLCVGTPRQGLLAPNARGTIEMLKLGDSSAANSVDGLEKYSHVWIIFVFHLNTQSKNPSKGVKSKIAPPALGGQKVGIFATRTPHRFNPIGITLCKLDRIVTNKEKATLHISGLDLVDGTPVLDIKPYVPVYDSVADEDSVKVPSWVAGGLEMKRSVMISEEARLELTTLLENDRQLLEFYGPKYAEKTVVATLDYALECIRQVLAIDVRSSYQTKKSRSGKSQAERSGRLRGNITTSNSREEELRPDDGLCTQQLDNLLIQYRVETASSLKRTPSGNSGAEDIVFVTSIQDLKR